MTWRLPHAAVFCVLLLSTAGTGQAQKQSDKPATAPPAPQEQEPPEEDESLKPKEYGFNPLQAAHDLQVGNFYFRKGNYRAAARRFSEASKWDPGYAEAFLRLGEAEEKLKDRKSARAAFEKYLELAPDAKDADSVRKKLAKK